VADLFDGYGGPRSGLLSRAVDEVIAPGGATI
jgi:hypothetical protein